MTKTVTPGNAKGQIDAIPSKSHLHRLLICAALANAPTVIERAKTEAEDIHATVNCLNALGAKIEHTATGFHVTPIATPPQSCVLPCHESGSTLRFMLPVVCALGVEGTFRMAGRLPKRPMHPLDRELEKFGITFSRPEADLLCCKGKLAAGDYSLPGDISSQYISGLLMALPLVEGVSRLTVAAPIESEDYITLTRQVLAEFGCQHKPGHDYVFSGQQFKTPSKVETEGDWSNAAFWLCAGAMPGGDILLRGTKPDSTQGDKEICDILAKMGANISWRGGDISVKESKRNAVEIDARAIPDLVPVLAAVASVSRGMTTIKNAGRLRIKESDRLMATAKTLNALGAKVHEEGEGLRIEGVPHLTGGIVDAHGDHRIAMMAAVAAMAATGEVTITGAEAVNKSYPMFWDDLKMLGLEVRG
ncbi:MAG: 3-phosphoshikimate 1-carboxyvinyltransferase [Defluviitaleaceae bacterium]|nr:3-phosphoshikimate 1-carboxyvinyltransferase [Defluviitaleaceae bacterium]